MGKGRGEEGEMGRIMGGTGRGEKGKGMEEGRGKKGTKRREERGGEVKAMKGGGKGWEGR